MPESNMVQEVIEQPVCGNCGVDVRDNTAFCYNCGTAFEEEGLAEAPEPQTPDPVPEGPNEDARAVLEDLEERLRKEEADSDKLAKAAAERKKARTKQRGPKEYTWVAEDAPASGMLISVAVLFAILAAVIVYLTVISR